MTDELSQLAGLKPRERKDAGESLMEQRLNSMPSPNDLPDPTVTTSTLALGVLARMGRFQSPREMYIRWGNELSPQEMCEIWKDVPGWTTPEVLKLYDDPRLHYERQAHRFSLLKDNTLPNYSDPTYRREAIKQQIANIQERLDLIGSRWREATESFVAYGAPGVRIASNSSLARLGRMEVDYINLWMKLLEELELLQERERGTSKSISEDAVSYAERRLERLRKQQQNEHTSLTIINMTQDNRTQVIQTGTEKQIAESQNQEALNGAPENTLPALPMLATSPTNTSS